MTKNRTPTPVYLDPGMHPGLEVKGLNPIVLQGQVGKSWKMGACKNKASDKKQWT